jgi:hypothetical protein
LCILSIFSQENGDFILTQNRDESHLRPTSDEILTREIEHKPFTGPIDLVSKGTWIYYSDEYVVCILNGEYEKHSHLPPYRKSRGLIVLEFLKFNSVEEFAKEIDLKGIEPFTMVMVHRKNSERKILVWNGKEKFLEDHSGEELIVRSSSTLYNSEEKEFHHHEFEQIREITSPEIMKMHDKLKMHPNTQFPTVQTTSITQIRQVGNQIELQFCPISY